MSDRRRKARLVFHAMCSVAFGGCVGGLVMGAVFQPLARLLQRPPPIELTPMVIVIGVWLHGMIGLSALAAGVAAAWFHCCWAASRVEIQKHGGEYGWVVAAAWLTLLIYAWHGMTWWRLTVEVVWPLFFVDIGLVVLAGILGRCLSARHAQRPQ